CSFFFFSSRRRHTRSKRDWSSDVCSSDLDGACGGWQSRAGGHGRRSGRAGIPAVVRSADGRPAVEVLHGADEQGGSGPGDVGERSEERRVGKEGRGRGWEDEERRKGNKRG